MLRLLGFQPQRERFSDAGGARDADALERQPLASSAASSSAAAAAGGAPPAPSSSSAAATGATTTTTTTINDDGGGAGMGSLVVRMLRQADESLFGGGGGGGGGRPGSPSREAAAPSAATTGPRRPPGGSGGGSASAVVSLTAMSSSTNNPLVPGHGQHHHHHHHQFMPKKPQGGPATVSIGAAANAAAAAASASASASAAPPAPPSSRALLLPAVYGLANLSSVVAIVVANKFALKTHGFSFPVALTWCHTAFTAAGMAALARLRLFEPKRVPRARSAPVAGVYVAFLVLNNLSIQLNTVGFYQVSKIAITPVIVAIERVCYGKRASGRVLAATAVLLSGVLLCSASDSQVAATPLAALVAAANVLVSALYQVWASTKQRELGVDGMQLLHQIAPPAVLMLGFMVPAVEPVGWASLFAGGAGGAGGVAGGGGSAAAGGAPPPPPASSDSSSARATLLTYDYTAPAVFWIALSSVLGLVVTATTFLFIGATSSLTYNVVGHFKTVGIVAAGVLLFGDGVGARRVVGLALAMGGILWYSRVKVQEQQQHAGAGAQEEGQGRLLPPPQQQQQQQGAAAARGG